MELRKFRLAFLPKILTLSVFPCNLEAPVPLRSRIAWNGSYGADEPAHEPPHNLQGPLEEVQAAS